MLLGFGFVIALVGLLLTLNVAGFGSYVIAHLTSRSLGSLAPGYAASPKGMRAYGWLITAIGIVIIGVEALIAGIFGGVLLVLAGVVTFLAFSVVIIRGEVKTYRAIKR